MEADNNSKIEKHNFLMHSLDGILFSVGHYFSEPRTILPAFVAKLTSSTFLVGLIPSVLSLGWFLPQMLFAYISEKYKFKKPLIWQIGIWMRIPWFFMFLGAVLFGVRNPSVAIIIFFISFTISALAGGANSPVWLDFVAGTVPVNMRGKLFSVRTAFGGFLGIGVSVIVAQLLGKIDFPLNYGVCFFCYFFFTSISIIFVLLIIEKPFQITRKHDSLVSYLKKVPLILKNHRNYFWYIVSRIYLSFLGIPSAFFTIYAIKKFGATDVDIAGFMLCSVITQSFTSLVWGYFADRTGHVRILRISYISALLSTVIAFFSSSIIHIYIIFILQGIHLGGLVVSGSTVILEFCAPEERPTYIGVSNTILFPFSAFLPLFAGFLLQSNFVGYHFIFILSGLISLVGLILLYAKVKEPRFINS